MLSGLYTPGAHCTGAMQIADPVLTQFWQELQTQFLPFFIFLFLTYLQADPTK